MLRKEHPIVDIKGQTVNVSDIESDPVAAFQHRHYALLFFLLSFLIPVMTPVLLFGESILNAIVICFIMRLVTQTHDTAFVNSAAHMFGEKPYNERMASTENSWVSFGAVGEGYHNFHHSFPYDYAAGEMGNLFNPTKLLIDFMFLVGQAYNLKQASRSVIEKCKKNSANNNKNDTHDE
jgi:stearoyl-CoA desaturase (delta-9 desaturase)